MLMTKTESKPQDGILLGDSPPQASHTEPSFGLPPLDSWSPSSEGDVVTKTRSLDWLGPNDPENPYNWSKTQKWIITAVAILATFTTTLNGTMITVAHQAINDEFSVSDASFPNSYWPVATWATGGALAGLVVLPLTEDFGIRSTFLCIYVVFMCFTIPQAVAQNFATLVVTRFFGGGCVCVLSNTAAALIGNIWEGDRARTVPLSIFVTLYLAGSSMGPVIAGVILENLGWRWISYMQLIWYGALFPVYVVFMKESRGSAILQRRAAREELARRLEAVQDAAAAAAADLKTGSSHDAHRRLHSSMSRRAGDKIQSLVSQLPPLLHKMAQSTKRPLWMLFTEPVLFTFTLWSSFMMGTVFLFTQSVEQVFSTLYGWSAAQAGYVQSAVVVGEILGFSAVLVNARLYFASARRNTECPGTPIPEARLYVSVVGSFVGVAGGMFVYGWTSFPDVPWIAPAIGLAMVGYGVDVVVIAIADYIVDSYTRYAASAIAAVVLGENLFAAFLPLAAQSMYTTLDLRWASTLLGCLALLLSFAPLAILVYGRQLRERSPFMKVAIVERREGTAVADRVASRTVEEKDVEKG